jgi:hypothetical protein
MRSVLLINLVVFVISAIHISPASGDIAPSGVRYLMHENWGGRWSDAEKTRYNYQDDAMCWAAAASNALTWTGWGRIDGMTDSDEIFKYFQDHWTDQGGQMPYAWLWWFTGASSSQGWIGWSQVDVPGGGFYSNENFSHFFHSSSITYTAMSTIDNYLRSGYGTTLGIYGPGGHALTAWGVSHDPDSGSYTGIYVTDSDDSKSQSNAPDKLRYYEVERSRGKWYLQDYSGSNKWYIGDISALAQRPAPSPGLQGDIDGDNDIDAQDINELAAILRDNNLTSTPNTSAIYDLNGDNSLDAADMDILICNILNTTYGDADLNGVVNAIDFAILSARINADGWENGDFDGNGIGNASDFLLLSNNFGYGLSRSPSRNANVPEPSTSILIALLTPLVLKRRSRSRVGIVT